MRSTSNWKIFCCRRWGPHLILEKSWFELRWEGLNSAALLPCPGILRSLFSLYECIDFVRIIQGIRAHTRAANLWFILLIKPCILWLYCSGSISVFRLLRRSELVLDYWLFGYLLGIYMFSRCKIYEMKGCRSRTFIKFRSVTFSLVYLDE
jgi:hypothetical protein